MPSHWRHLDLGTWQLEIRSSLRRLRCPTHGVVVEAVPFARPGAHLTRDLDDLLVWLATRMDRSAVARLCRVSWRTVGRACERVVATSSTPTASWSVPHRRGRDLLAQVPRVPHPGGRPRPAQGDLGAKGKDAKTLDSFFDDLGPQRSAQLAAVSLDLGPAFPMSVQAEGHAPQAVVCADPIHLVKLVSEALDEVRRELWNQLRGLPDDRWAKDFKGRGGHCSRTPRTSPRPRLPSSPASRRNRGGI